MTKASPAHGQTIRRKDVGGKEGRPEGSLWRLRGKMKKALEMLLCRATSSTNCLGARD